MRIRDINRKQYEAKSLKYWPQFCKKDYRKLRNYNQAKYSKYLKKMVREHQKEFNGIDIRNLIPKNTFYCKDCQFWYSIEIPGAINKEDGEAENEVWDQHPGLVAVGQHWIGGCKLIKQTDDDMNGFGLLWDSCKECSINE